MNDRDESEGRSDDGKGGEESAHELRISKIRNGTVIDHIAGGHAPDVLAILGIDSATDEVVSVGMNVPSDRLGYKDVVKIEARTQSGRSRGHLARRTRGLDQHHPRVRRDREESRRTACIRRGRALVSEPQLHHHRGRTGRHPLRGARRRRALSVLRDDHPSSPDRPHRRLKVAFLPAAGARLQPPAEGRNPFHD